MKPTEIPTLASGAPLGLLSEFRTDRLGVLTRMAAFAPFARVRFAAAYVHFVSTAAVAHEFLVEKARHFEKSPGVRLLLYYLGGEGLFTSEGELWRRQRKLMAPLFQPGAIAQYAECMSAVAHRTADRWRDGERIDIGRETTQIAMAVVGKALFDSDTFDEADALGEALTAALQWTNDNSASPRLVAQLMTLTALERARGVVPARFEARRAKAERVFREPFMLAGARGDKLQGAIGVLDGRIQQMIDERRAQGFSRNDLLTRLLVARDADEGPAAGMTDKQVRDEATTLFVAGHETTATALAWAFYLLGRHPDVYARVQAEVDALPEGAITFADAAKLPLTLRVFKESMRLYPPVLLYARRALSPVSLGGYDLPRGALVFVSPYVVHRQAEVWPDPERFDPDRFLPEREAARPKTSYLPFGAGPRVCIGSHFALLEGPIVMATLMRRARFEVDPREVRPGMFATLRPNGGVHATVHLRHPAQGVRPQA